MQRLEQGLRRLKLRRVREVLEDYNRLAVTQQLRYLDFIAGLVNEEVTAREQTHPVSDGYGCGEGCSS